METEIRAKTKKGSFTTDMIVIYPKQEELGSKSLPCKAFSDSSAGQKSGRNKSETKEKKTQSETKAKTQINNGCFGET